MSECLFVNQLTGTEIESLPLRVGGGGMEGCDPRSDQVNLFKGLSLLSTVPVLVSGNSITVLV